MNKLPAFVVVAMFLFALCACNTIAGVGKDVQRVGQAVEGVARK